VMLEYQLPLTSRRLDFMVTGKGPTYADNAVIVELKQWSKCGPTDGENEVATFVGGTTREVLHPSAQVGRYRMYLRIPTPRSTAAINPFRWRPAPTSTITRMSRTTSSTTRNSRASSKAIPSSRWTMFRSSLSSCRTSLAPGRGWRCLSGSRKADIAPAAS